MAADTVLEFTDANFKDEVLSSDTPVLVDFWAEWCQPCRLIAPTIDEIAGEYDGKVKVGKVDVDKNRQISVDYQITAIPTILIFKGGDVAKKFVGMTQKADLETAIKELG